MIRLLVFALSFFAMGALASIAQSGGALQRLRPPAPLTCPRNQLTSFQGRILAYKRSKNLIVLRVRTDEETTETFSLKWQATEKAEKWFLLRGEKFTPDDWKQIESVPGKLFSATRVIVWVCNDGSKPIFDWQPKAQ